MLHELIKNRRSVRAFSAKPVSGEVIHSLLEAASWAASSMNEQPWRYLYATPDDPERFRQFLDCLMPANRVWAKNAPLLVLSLAKTTHERNGKPNKYAFYDVGGANTTLSLQATALGMQVHQMGGFDAALTREVLQLPEDVEPVCFIAVGYPGNIEDLPEELRIRETAPRSRKPLDLLVFKPSLEAAS